jgi:hypothetical protein
VASRHAGMASGTRRARSARRGNRFGAPAVRRCSTRGMTCGTETQTRPRPELSGTHTKCRHAPTRGGDITIHKIDPRLSDLDDRKLLIALHQLGWQGLITNNYKMLRVPAEIAAIVKTKLAVFAVEGIGDDPLRATGAVLLHLPSVAKQIQTGKARVFRVNPRAPQPEDAWEFFRLAAERRKRLPLPYTTK